MHADNLARAGLDSTIAVPLLERLLQAPRSIPFGYVICLATLGEPIRDGELAARLGLPAPAADGDASTNWGWPLTDIAPVTPIARARGALGWWRWQPGDIEC